jgi:predicted small integral membrane protein
VTLRIAKVLLVFGVAFYYMVIVFNNLTDYDSNYQFVRHVLMMDSTFPGNRGMWHAINTPRLHTSFYLLIIAWETLSMILCLAGGAKLAAALWDSPAAFNAAKRVAILGFTVSLMQWLVAFLVVAGEWFMMWQSKNWNGQDAAFRMFAVIGIALLFLAQPDTIEQP